MEEEHPYIPYAPPTPPKKEHKALKMLGLTLLLLLLAGSASYGVLAWMKNGELEAKVADEQSKSKALTSENSQLKSQLEAKPETANITDTLPDDRKITYPDTVGNRNILWWSAGKNNGGVVLSHKAFQQYLATVDSKLVTEMCGTDSKPKAAKYNISAGVLDTATKELAPTETSSCVDLFASTSNKDETSRADAQKVLETVNTEVTAFIESATIE